MRSSLRPTAHALLGLVASPAPALAHALSSSGDTARDAGVSGLWILANFSYAGMRAQGSRSTGRRIVAFLFGFPGTLLSLLLIKEGSERAYGVDVPRRRPVDVPRRRPPEHTRNTGGRPTAALYSKDTGAFLGTIDDADLQLLVDRLEEEQDDDSDYYYVSPATIEMLEESGASAGMLEILRDAVGSSEGVDIIWKPV